MANNEFKDFSKEGLLEKKGMGSLWRPWTTRKFILSNHDHKLSYYDTQTGVLKGSLTLRGAKVQKKEPKQSDGRQFTFEVYNLADENKKKSSLVLQALNNVEVEDWVEKLNIAFNSCAITEGKDNHSDRVKKKPEFNTVVTDGLKKSIPIILSLASAVPMVSSFASSIQKFYDAIDKVSTNSQEIIKLTEVMVECSEWVESLSTELKNQDILQAFNSDTKLIHAFEKLKDSINAGTQFVEDSQSRLNGKMSIKNTLKNIVLAGEDSKKLENLRNELGKKLSSLVACKQDFYQQYDRKCRSISLDSFYTNSNKISPFDYSVCSNPAACFEALGRWGPQKPEKSDVREFLKKVNFYPNLHQFSLSEANCFVIKSLYTYFSGDAEVIVDLLQVTYKFAGDSKNRRFFGLIGICSIVLNNIDNLSSTKDILRYGLGAIRGLCVQDFQNTDQFVCLDTVYKIRTWIGWFKGDPDEVKLNIVGNGIMALECFAMHESSLKPILDTGVCELVIDCLSKSPENAKIIQTSCSFIEVCTQQLYNYIHDESYFLNILERIANADTFEILIKVSELNLRSTDLIYCIIRCFCDLVSNSYMNKDRFSSVGGCEKLYHLLKRYEGDQNIVYICSLTISCLLSNSSCKEKFEKITSPDISLSALLINLRSKYKRQEQVILAIENTISRLDDPKFVSDTMAASYPAVIKDCCHGHELQKIVCAYDNKGFSCDICQEYGSGWSYNCAGCKYDAHLVCADSRPLLVCREHTHGLRITMKPRTETAICDLCLNEALNSYAFCFECNFDICKSCCDKEGMLIATQEVCYDYWGQLQSVFTVEACNEKGEKILAK